jgi:hypothetical protein
MKKLPVFTLGVEEEYQIIDPTNQGFDDPICPKLWMVQRLY